MAIDILHGTGYRVGETDRAIGNPTATPDDFVVLNQQSGALFIVVAGIWADGGIYPQIIFDTTDFDLWLIS